MNVAANRGRRAALVALAACLVSTLSAVAPTVNGPEQLHPAGFQAASAPGLLDGLLGALAPAPAPPPPSAATVPGGTAPSTGTQRGAAASTVKVSGVACGFRVSGSGFSVGGDAVVTNAHVVAGVANPGVRSADGRELPARAVVFDPVRDVAVLSVPGLDEPALPLGSAVPGTAGTVFGHPHGQDDVEASPVRVAGRQRVPVPDIYNRRSTLQDIVTLGGTVQKGDSGAAVVDAAGSVVAMVFAVDEYRPGVGYAIPSEDLRSPLSQPRQTAVATGPCLG